MKTQDFHVPSYYIELKCTASRKHNSRKCFGAFNNEKFQVVISALFLNSSERECLIVPQASCVCFKVYVAFLFSSVNFSLCPPVRLVFLLLSISVASSYGFIDFNFLLRQIF